MIEPVALIVAAAVALTFFSDATSDTRKIVRSARRRGVHVGSRH